jgi:hypothetical protein
MSLAHLSYGDMCSLFFFLLSNQKNCKTIEIPFSLFLSLLWVHDTIKSDSRRTSVEFSFFFFFFLILLSTCGSCICTYFVYTHCLTLILWYAISTLFNILPSKSHHKTMYVVFQMRRCASYSTVKGKKKKKNVGSINQTKGKKRRVHCQCHSQLTSAQALEKRTDVQRVTI